MTTVSVDRIKSIKTFASLVKYLRDDLDWPLEAENIDDLAFDYDPEEVGLDESYAEKIKSIKQLRPLVSGQPWAIFYVEFKTERLPVVILRRILRALVIKRRASANKAERAVWQMNDLLFISALGEEAHRGMSFAHFHGNGDSLPELRTFSWDERETHFYYLQNLNLERLRWPENERNVDVWRNQWTSAFAAGHREAVGTAKQLSTEMARIAIRVREVVKEILPHESKKTGQLKKLFAAFKKVLIHDLDDNSFADMIAQTVVYGLFTARVTGDKVLGLHQLEELVPVTNPFLRDLFAQLTEIGGKGRHQFDVDELGISELVDLLNTPHMDNVMRDFGRQTGGGREDPVIHFYEEFLKAYDKKQKVKRGEFYTPLPVVSYIVRSVHEILIKEFDLPLGLADTTTWGEMTIKHPGVNIPDGVSSDAPFVQILDPATGTGTFLAFTIDLIHETMVTHWRSLKKKEAEIKGLWNEYVPNHLLTRLYGFQLVVAPYAVAHMRIGMKLRETGYVFANENRLRVYLTNTLEPPTPELHLLRELPGFLSHEAFESDHVKRTVPVTVIIGNPPYAGISSNRGTWITNLIDEYRFVDGQPMEERKIWVKNDYVKFLRFAQARISATGCGLVCMITDHSYLDSPTFRGMRHSLLKSFAKVTVANLHGNAKRRESSTNGDVDENVFDITQGVSIGLFYTKCNQDHRGTHYVDFWGEREVKYQALRFNDMTSGVSSIQPNAPQYLLVPVRGSSSKFYMQGLRVNEVFDKGSNGVQTSRDGFAVGWHKIELVDRIQLIKNKGVKDEELRELFGVNDTSFWTLSDARTALRKDAHVNNKVVPFLYRPFDQRWLIASPAIVHRLRDAVMRHMQYPNIALAIGRAGLVVSGQWSLCFCTRWLCDHNLFYRGSSQNYPLYIYRSGIELDELPSVQTEPVPNLAQGSVRVIEDGFGIKWSPHMASLSSTAIGPNALLWYIYAILHSPSYRDDFSEFLQTDYPRIPVSRNQTLLHGLCSLGADLIALHSLTDDYSGASWNNGTRDHAAGCPLVYPISTLRGRGDNTVEDGFPLAEYSESIYINETKCIDGVPMDVWNFHIGGYQVCHKWLKDRQGRTLTDEDIRHYHRIVVAIKETIRLMKEIDDVINEHGGWPDAFRGDV